MSKLFEIKVTPDEIVELFNNAGISDIKLIYGSTERPTVTPGNWCWVIYSADENHMPLKSKYL